MADVLATLTQFWQDHWQKIVTPLVSLAVGWYFGTRRAQRNFAKREFYDRLNVSLNILRDGKLQIRTLLEKRCEDIFLNSVAAGAVVDAARKTTEQDCLLNLPEKDYWYYLNSVLNEISEQFSEGQIKRDLGHPVKCEEYVICLTSEAAGNIRMRKVRAMVIQKKSLLGLQAEQPRLENASHATRWATLQFLAKAYAAQPHRFLTVELCM